MALFSTIQRFWKDTFFLYCAPLFLLRNKDKLNIDQSLETPPHLKSPHEERLSDVLLSKKNISVWLLVKHHFVCYQQAYWSYFRRFPFDVLFSLLLPVALAHTVDVLEQPLFDAQQMMFTVGALVTVIFLRGLFISQTVFSLRCLRLSTNRLFSLAIIKKIMKMRSRELSVNHHGHMIHLINRDSFLATRLILSINSLLRTFLIMMSMTLMLLVEIGNAAVIGLSCILTATVICFYLTRKRLDIEKKMTHEKDKRISVISEFFKKFRQIRMTGFTGFFTHKSTILRENESRFLLKSHIFTTLNQLIITITPLIMSLLTFAYLHAQGIELTLGMVFTTIGLFMLMRPNINNIASEVTSLIETLTSLNRIKDFLNKTSSYVDLNTKELPLGQVQIQDVSLNSQDDNHKVLTDISLNIEPGALIAITGPTGSGKSAILNLIAGYDDQFEGQIKRHGKLSHLQQYMWLSNDTLRNNILFGEPFDEQRYVHVLSVCQLTTDLDHLPHGDQTLVGELGIRLSGGQQQRVALARALYSQADILLLDNPMSALDPTVAQRLFEEGIRPNSQQTKILITHDLSLIRQCDQAYQITNGKLEKLDLELDSPSSYLVMPSSIDHSQIENINSLENKTYDEESHGNSEFRWSFVKELIQQSGWFSILATGILCLFFFESFRLFSEVWLASESHQLSREPSPDYTDTLINYFGFVTLALLAYFGAQIILFTRQVNHMKNSHKTLLSRLSRTKTSFFDEVPQGRIVSRFDHDIDICSGGMIQIAAGICTTLFALLLQMGTIAWYMPYLIPFIAIIACCYGYLQRTYQQIIKKVSRLRSVEVSKSYTLAEEMLRGVDALRLGKKVQYSIDNILYQNERIIRTHITTCALFSWFFLRLAGLSAITTFITAVLISVFNQSDLINVLALTYVVLISGIIIGFMYQIEQLDQVLVAGWRVAEYSLLPSEEYYPSQKVTKENKQPVMDMFEVNEPEISCQTKLNKPKSVEANIHLKLAHVYLTYPNTHTEVLKDISFEIQQGEKVGICGRTGAGKSSIMSILLGLYPISKGQIYYNNRPIHEMPLEHRRKLFSTITQSPLLFHDTLQKNLDPYNQHEKEQLFQAIKNVGLNARLQELPQGLLTEVKDGLFSSGESQQIVLARLLLENRPFVLLDEATSDLDPRLMRWMSSKLYKHKLNTTFILIAHHLEPLLNMDKILVIDSGRIIQSGPPLQLIRNEQGPFAQMFKKQLQAEEPLS